MPTDSTIREDALELLREVRDLAPGYAERIDALQRRAASAEAAERAARLRRAAAEDEAVRLLNRQAREEAAARVRAVCDSASWHAHNERAQECFAAADALRAAPRRAAEAEAALDRLAAAADEAGSAADLAAIVYSVLAEYARAARPERRTVGL